MKVRELIEILHDCDGDQDVLIWDSSTGETLNIESHCEMEEGDDTLAFEIDCKRDPHLESKCAEIAEKWDKKYDELHQQAHWCRGRNLELDAILLTKLSDQANEVRRELELFLKYRV